MTGLTYSPAYAEFRYWGAIFAKSWRPVLVNSIVNPVLFLAGIGLGLGQLVDANAPLAGGLTYAAFFAPGLLAAAAMQTAVVEGGQTVFSAVRNRRSYLVAAYTPLQPHDILNGHLLFIAARILLSSTMFTAVMYAFGVAHALTAMLAIPVAVLLGLACAAPTAAWAVTVRRAAVIGNFSRFVVMPVYLFSATFFPIEVMPGWLQPVVYASPLWHGARLCRALTTGTATLTGAAADLAVLAVTALAGYLAARRTYRRHLHA
ncbi:transport permease protein [Catellatospora sp. TT07R-123]|uniref:ABC transporter permease n=1 Tax=Catellatospora sp. TT07R-123 TaxID=2733863 RepID=UPI001B008772|nr:ABC transporter permease [Catellatospora sp. TT07R-123]GHJ47533.1 transport permease protein [Catellatospora sp. TT07R-123]